MIQDSRDFACRDPTDNYSAMVRVMACCHQTTSHYLNQCLPFNYDIYGITKAKRVQLTNYQFNSMKWNKKLESITIVLHRPQFDVIDQLTMRDHAV